VSDVRRAAAGEIETEILARIERETEAAGALDLANTDAFDHGCAVGRVEALKALRKWIVEEFNAR
jgi:hypothetical protein